MDVGSTNMGNWPWEDGEATGVHVLDRHTDRCTGARASGQVGRSYEAQEKAIHPGNPQVSKWGLP